MVIFVIDWYYNRKLQEYWCLKEGVNEGSHRTSFGQDDQQAHQKQKEYDRTQPPFFPGFEEAPEFWKDRKLVVLFGLVVHGLSFDKSSRNLIQEF